MKKNLKDIVDIERKNCTIEDPDFGLMVSDKAWTSNKFMDFIKKKNTYTYTISEGDLIIGFLLFEVKENEVVIEKFCVDKDFKNCGFETELLNFVYLKNYRNKVVFYCPEEDDESIIFFKQNNYTGKLSKDYFGFGKDAIKFNKEVV